MKNFTSRIILTSKHHLMRNIYVKLLMGLVFVFGVVGANAQVTTNGGSGLAATYTSLANAITALNAATITAPVTITLTGNETAPAGGYSITQLGGTVTNTITITGSGSTITAYTPQVAGQKYDAIFKIVGGDWITIQSFTMQENVLNTVSTLASNTMTEFGVALFAATTTNGAQNNTIQNNIITLSSATKYQNAIGIFSTCASSSTNATLAAASIAGTNSNNKFYSNTISGVAHGIYFITPVQTATVFESGNDIGGSSAATGNTITFGATNTAGDLGFTSYSGAIPAGIYFRNPVGSSAKYNTITSVSTLTLSCAGIIGANGTPPSGITYTTTFSNNSITITNVGVTAISGIDFGSGLATGTFVSSNNNITINQNSVAANPAAIIGIKASYPSATNTCNNNIVVLNQSETTGVLSSTTIGISLAGNSTTITANSNNITINQTGSGTGTITGAIIALNVAGTSTTNNVLTNTILVNQTTTVASGITNAITGILATSAATTLNITTNNVITVKQAVTGSGTYTTGAVTYVNAAGTHGTANIVSNTFNTTGSTIRSTGTLTVVSCEGTVTSLYNVKSNTATIDRMATAGNVFFTGQTTTPSNVADTVSLNTITFTNLATSGTVTGVSQLGGPGTIGVKNICNNIINISGTNTGTTKGIAWGYSAGAKVSANSVTISCAAPTVIGLDGTGIQAGGDGGISLNTISLSSSTTSPTSMIGITGGSSGPFQIFNNTFSAMNFTGIITGSPVVSGIALSIGTGNNINNNVITNISVGAATSAASPTIDGILISGGVSTNVFKNKIYGITTAATGITTVVNGIRISGGGTTANNVYNNLIGNLTASASMNTDAIRGISITSTSTTTLNNVYFNTVYLSGGGGANFGSSGIFHAASATATTAALDMRNNIIVNNCTVSGTGFVVAFRRSAAATLGNFATTSNRNALIAGSLMYDGTHYLTLAAYQTAVSTREANSFTTEAFTYGTAGSFFQSLTGSDATYLQLVAGITTQCESGASAISTPAITDDYKGTTRNITTPDVGADEFAGVSPAPLVTLTSVSPSGNQCSATARVVTVDVTTPAGTITGVTISYNNGAAAGPLAMTNTSGTTWTYTIPAASPTNTIVTWSVTATNSASLIFTYTGASYQDNPTFGVTATATATNASVCTGGTTSLSMAVSKSGTAVSGTGTGLNAATAWPTAFQNYLYQDWQQYLFTAAELNAIGLYAGNITSLAFNISALPSPNPAITDYNIKIGTTSNTTFTGATSFVTTNLTNVFGPATVTAAVGINQITFSSPFNWDGISNIIVDLRQTGHYGSGNATTYYTVTSNNSTLYNATNTSIPTYWATNPIPGIANIRPNITFTGNLVQAPSAYSWSDGSSVVGTTNPLTVTVNATSTYTCTATITNSCPITASVLVTALALPSSPTASNSSQCGTAIPTASVADPNGFTTPTFKWYDAASAGTLLQSSTSTTYTSNIAATTTFYVSVINPTTNCESARSPVTVTVSTAPALTITASQTVCNNEIVELDITSTIADYDVYTWTPSTYLFTDAAATVAYTGNGNPSIVYFKSATGAANIITLNSSNTSSGCTNLATSTVSVLPSTITASAAVPTFCLSGSTSVSVATIPAGATVQWQSSPDNATWTDIASATLATVATGTITSTTYYRLAVNKTGGQNCLYSNVVTVTVKQTMSGTYTVGAGGNYTSLTSAVADLACVGVSGAVVLSLTDAAYNSGETFPITITAIIGASATNTITIKPATGVNANITGSSAVAIIKLNGADYITIDGSNSAGSSRDLTIVNTNTGTSSAVIWLASVASPANGATINTIKNTIITGNAPTTTFVGIISSGSVIGAVAEAQNSGDVFQNNSITASYYGIALVGATANDVNCYIANNTIGSATAASKIGLQGIYVSQQQGVSITGNTVLGITNNGNVLCAGIVVGGTISGGSITANSISDIKNATNRQSFGIELISSTANTGMTIANNLVFDVNNLGTSATLSRNGHGIAVMTGGGYNLYYNTVSLNSTNLGTTSGIIAALYIAPGVTALDIRNNIFANSQTLGTRYAIYSDAPNTAFSTIDFNNYSSTGTAVGYLGSSRTGLADIVTGFGQNSSSLSVTPNFISTTNLHLVTSTNCGLDGRGTPISGITTDYDLDTRNATIPDIGADEFTSSFSASAGTAQSVCGTSVTMAASLSNGTGTWTPIAGLTYTPNTTTATAGVSGLTASNAGTATVFTWTITGAGSCNSALPVTITAYNPRTVNAGVDQTVCSSSPNVTLAGTKGGSASSSTVTWTTSGTGTFDNANSLTAVYTVSAADISAGSVTLTLTTDNTPGPCIAVYDQMVITINPRATANANIDQTVCAGSPDVTLAGSIGGSATTATWTGGTGTFNPDNTSLTAVYTPSAAEITAGTVTLTLTTDDPAGVCAAATDQMVITIRPSAIANAGTDQSVCVSSPSVTLNGSIGGSALSGTWSGGIGTFTPDNTTLNAVYTPAVGENAAGMVITLTLTTAGPCAVTTDDMLISIHGNPDVPTGSAAQAFCTAGTIADLSATGTSIQWYAAATGGSAISSGTALVDGTTYYASQTVGICESVTRLAVTVTLNPAATANAGTPQSICAGNTVTLAGTIGGGASSATWSGGLGTFSPNATTLDAVYTPTAGEITAGAGTLTLTTDNPAGPCGAVTSNMTITISTNSGSLVSSAIPVCKTMSVGTGAVYTSGACDIIDKVVPNGASPVNGVINSCVTIDATVQSYNSEPYLQRHFDITPSTNPLTSSARITLYVLQLEFDDFNLANAAFPDLPATPADAAGISNLRITKYSGTGTAPGNYTPGVVTLIDPDDVDIVWNGSYWEISFDISGFSGFYIHTGYGNPLPLNLLNFGGYKDGSVNQLRWSTANEINSRGFEVQRSVDGIHYSAIGFVNSVGQNGTTNNYVYTDRAVVGDRQYYRLRQVDLDGHSKLSNIVLIRGDKLNVLQVQGLYPNPATSQINLLLSSPIQEKMQLQLMDITGRTVVQRWISVETGSNNIPVNINMLSSGSYLVKLLGASSQETIVAKFVKQ